MRRPRLLFAAALAVALVQIGILVSMIAGRAAILRNGQEIALRVEPVDPRDLLRGDYVVLGYNISDVPRALLAEPMPTDGSSETSDTYAINVRVAPDEDGIYQPVAAWFHQPPGAERQASEVDIRGLVQHWRSVGQPILRVEYGIERFYIPEGQGRVIEEGMRERDFIMRVAVASGGTAQIKAFYEGDRLLYEEPWY